MREKLITGFRVLIEGFYTWSGAMLTLYIRALLLEDPVSKMHWDVKWLYALLILGTIAAVIWILVSRRKDLDTKISTTVFVILNIIPAGLMSLYAYGYLTSFD